MWHLRRSRCGVIDSARLVQLLAGDDADLWITTTRMLKQERDEAIRQRDEARALVREMLDNRFGYDWVRVQAKARGAITRWDTEGKP